MNKKLRNFFPGLASPKNSRRACLCKDKILIQENAVMALYGLKVLELYQEQFENAKNKLNHVI